MFRGRNTTASSMDCSISTRRYRYRRRYQILWHMCLLHLLSDIAAKKVGDPSRHILWSSFILTIFKIFEQFSLEKYVWDEHRVMRTLELMKFVSRMLLQETYLDIIRSIGALRVESVLRKNNWQCILMIQRCLMWIMENCSQNSI